MQLASVTFGCKLFQFNMLWLRRSLSFQVLVRNCVHYHLLLLCFVADDEWGMFYRTMHYSAKRGIVIACRPSVRPSVCGVGGSGAHRWEILETNCTDN